MKREAHSVETPLKHGSRGGGGGGDHPSVCRVEPLSSLDRVSVPSPIAIDILMVHNGEGQSSHVLVFCVNFERHSCTHFTTSIKCYLNSLIYVYLPFINI